MAITEAVKKERKRALKVFVATPQSMDAICNSIHLVSGKQVHKDLLRAIIQVTGYGKEHVKAGGLIEPRKILPDSTCSTKFTKEFQALVDKFLNQLKAGILFFPVIVPRYEGWVESFWPETERFVWKGSFEEQADIRGGIMLMFENIKNNGVAIDLSKAEVYESFIGDDCDDCGSGDVDNPNDDIVFCDNCHLGHHQSCYGIYPKPGPKDPWSCNGCTAAKQDRTSGTRKRKSSSAHEAVPKRRDGRQNERDTSYKGVNNNVGGEDRASSPIGTPDKETTPEVNTLEETASKDNTPKPDPRLSHKQIEGTILVTRLKDQKVSRTINLTDARTVDALFKECTQRWEGKFGDCVSTLLYIDDDNHLIEIVKGHSADYVEFLRMIRSRWNNTRGDNVRVQLMLLAAGEVEEI